MDLISLISGMPRPLATILVAMFPWTELRVAIPIAIQAWHIDPLEAAVLSVVGNLVPMLAILYGYEPLEAFTVRKLKWTRPFFAWIKKRSHEKLHGRFQKFGDIALCLFVILPIPGTGVWTGSIAASLFHVKKQHALTFITLGAILSAALITGITMAVKYGFGV